MEIVEKQAKLNVEEQMEEVVESEVRDSWWGWFFTVNAPFCVKLIQQKDVLCFCE